MSDIHVIGAREHNLKNVTVRIPKKKIVVFTGVSGSGKSSLVFDTVYAEAQRQLIETFSSFARRRLPKINRPDVDEIHNITTTIIIDQKKMGNNPRSTVGTATELYTYLRLLYSRCGEPVTFDSRFFGFNNPYGMCPKCRGLGREMEIDLDALIDWDKSLNDGAIKLKHFKKTGWFFRTIKSSELFDLDMPLKDWSREKLDLLLYSDKLNIKTSKLIYDFNFYGIVPLLERRIVNHDETPGYLDGDERVFIYKPCSECGGSRINEKARSVKLNNKTIPELVDLELTELLTFLNTVKGPVSDPIVNRMKPILQNLIDIGVGYLSLNRGVGTLSGGESQRVKMARQLGIDLTDLTYIFDEPTVGLHQRDVSKLVEILEKLKETGNTLLVVEHDQLVMKNSDYIIDLGPRAGVHGGLIQFEGTYEELLVSDTLTGDMLRNRISYNGVRRNPKDSFRIVGASMHNLKNITVKIPKDIFVCITGVAGSGKSSLILDVFAKDHPDAVVIDQSSIGRSSRSNPATFTKVFDEIRKLFAQETRSPANLFSFNSDGACPKCKGSGKLEVEMFFLESVSITCDECMGKRYKQEVLELTYNGKNINDVLELTIDEAHDFFEAKKIRSKLKILRDVGLGYLKLGQPVSTLSGGEAQRIKLARELNKWGNIYILDEPTTGLHMADVEKLLKVINRLVERGNTVIVIEHNLDVIKNADWIIDMGPEGGSKGGEIIAEGTPEEIAENPSSFTGQYLKYVL